jgi:hypothetical protein
VLGTQRKKNHELINYVYIFYSVQLAKSGVTIGNFETAEDVPKKTESICKLQKTGPCKLAQSFYC